MTVSIYVISSSYIRFNSYTNGEKSKGTNAYMYIDELGFNTYNFLNVLSIMSDFNTIYLALIHSDTIDTNYRVKHYNILLSPLSI